MAQSRSLTEVVQAAVNAGLGRLELQLPVRVESYDSARQVVRVSPLLRELVDEEGDGQEVPHDLPVVDEVPVEWPGAGGARLTFPIAVGDTGLLVMCGRSLDEWKAAPNRVVTPADTRRHAFMDAVFRPGLKSPAAPWKGVRTDAVTLGYESGMQIHIGPDGIALGEQSPAYAVALAEKVVEALDSIKSAFNGHTHSTTQGPSGTPAGAGAVGARSVSLPSTIASSSVKVKG